MNTQNLRLLRPDTETAVTSTPLLDVGRGNQPLKAEIMDAVSEIIDSGWFIGGPHVKALESKVAEASQTEFAVGCASGSDAILLALMAVGIQPGDEVICPSFTFFATASAIHRLGAKPVFIDIEPTSFNLDVSAIESLITDKTKAIIPVHLFGQCADMNPILEIANRHGIKVIEDCAQSIGATESERAAGSIGDVGCFSFYPTKNLGGFGDGGMLTTNDPEIADRLRLLANHGMRPRYFHQEVGINSRLDAIQAAVLCAKMNHLNEYSEKRSKNASNYRRLMLEAGLGSMVSAPSTMPRCGHVWNQFTIRIPGGQRDQIRQRLADMQVGSEVYYPVPLHQQECFAYLSDENVALPETERAASEVLSLPIFPELTYQEQTYAVACLAKALGAGQTLLRMVG
ncbi:MAG: dTDP-4-amino-4,6-dideoxygalactose transaminase [Mariniblastus sp.]|jgi:dTDP-4-amino-4,6-dideoxygalactose transaminase